jgi:hypothetical protein
MAEKIEHKYLAHYVDATFGGDTPNYVRLGDDLEEYNEELNPDVEIKKNIKGEQSIDHKGYDVQSDVDPYYASEGDALWGKLSDIANERKTGAACKTTKVDALFTESGTCEWAYREDVALIPNSIGGDTSGVQIPFTVYNLGNRVKGTFNTSTNTFTANDNS